MPVNVDRREVLDRVIVFALDYLPDCLFVGMEKASNRPTSCLSGGFCLQPRKGNAYVNIRVRATSILVLLMAKIPLPMELGPLYEVDMFLACDNGPIQIADQVAFGVVNTSSRGGTLIACLVQFV